MGGQAPCSSHTVQQSQFARGRGRPGSAQNACAEELLHPQARHRGDGPCCGVLCDVRRSLRRLCRVQTRQR